MKAGCSGESAVTQDGLEMSKLKTHRGAAKRFRRSGSGFKHRSANRNHILTKKAPKRKRQLRTFKQVSDGDKGSVRRMVPKKAR